MKKVKNEPKYLLNDKMFKHVYRKKIPLKSFLKGFFEYIGKEEPLKEINAQIEYIFQKNKWKEKEQRGDIVIYTKHYIINIEAQTSLNINSLKKDLRYFSKLDGSQLDEKEDTKKEKKIIGIIIAEKISKKLGLPEVWFQRYNFKSDAPEYKELPSNIEIYILDVDKAREIGYYDGGSNLLLKHLKIMGEKSLKVIYQIAREEEELMILAATYADLRQARKIKRWTSEEKARVIGYGDGMEKGIQENKIEIAKNMLIKNLEIPLISEVTGLTVEEIEKLKEKNN